MTWDGQQKNIKKTIPFAFQFWKMLAPSPQKVLQLLLRLAIFDEVRTSANPFVNSKASAPNDH